MTCRRNRLPNDILPKYLHSMRTTARRETKVTRFFEPVFAVKYIEVTNDSEEYTHYHISFQSSWSCNFTTVNALNSCSLAVAKCDKGQNENKGN